MLLYRSLSLGFLGACLLLLATRPPVVVEQTGTCAQAAPAARVRACPPIPPGPTILDVAWNTTGGDVAPTTADDIARLLHLDTDEHIVAVDDLPVANSVAAGVALGKAYLSPGRYVDLDVHGPAGERRVLVLMH